VQPTVAASSRQLMRPGLRSILHWATAPARARMHACTRATTHRQMLRPLQCRACMHESGWLSPILCLVGHGLHANTRVASANFVVHVWSWMKLDANLEQPQPHARRYVDLEETEDYLLQLSAFVARTYLTTQCVSRAARPFLPG